MIKGVCLRITVTIFMFTIYFSVFLSRRTSLESDQRSPTVKRRMLQETKVRGCYNQGAKARYVACAVTFVRASL
jgi:hypothetical protein